MDATVKPRQHRRGTFEYVAWVVCVLVALGVTYTLVTNENYEWDVVFQYFTAPTVLAGVRLTIVLTIVTMFFGCVLGMVVAVMRASTIMPVRILASAYITFFRGTPVLVQLFIWYSIPSVLQSISLGIPFGPSWLITDDPKTLITQFVAVCLGLGLNEAAYMAEIARAGILSVGEGQVEAASALGMTRLQSMRRIVLPQAMRVIVPPTGNETISMLKTTSLAFAVGFKELFGQSQIISGRNFQIIALLIVASIWYLFMTTVLTIGQYYVERRFARGALRQLPPTPFQKLRARFRGAPA